MLCFNPNLIQLGSVCLYVRAYVRTWDLFMKACTLEVPIGSCFFFKKIQFGPFCGRFQAKICHGLTILTIFRSAMKGKGHMNFA